MQTSQKKQRAHHNMGQSWRQLGVSECTAFPGNAHQLQLLLGVAAAQVQLDSAQKQAVLIIQLGSRYDTGEMHRGRGGTRFVSLMANLLTPTAACQLNRMMVIVIREHMAW